MSSYQYAAYGSNLHPSRLQKRVASARWLGTSFLPGYSLRFHKKSDTDGTGKCSILAGGSGVFFAVFDIAGHERQKLDAIEGLGSGYEGREISLDGFGTCSTYVAAPAFVDDSLAPVDWYREYVIRGARFNEFPVEYISRLESVRSVPDTNPKRSAREWQLINDLCSSRHCADVGKPQG